MSSLFWINLSSVIKSHSVLSEPAEQLALFEWGKKNETESQPLWPYLIVLAADLLLGLLCRIFSIFLPANSTSGLWFDLRQTFT